MSAKPSIPSVPEFEGIDRARFESEIVPAGRPAVLRGAVAHWPIVAAALESPSTVADYLRERATDEGAEAWFAEPEIRGRFGFNDEINGFNHDRRQATVGQLLDLLLRQQGDPQPWGIYAGAMPLRRLAPRVLAENIMPLLAPGRYMLISLWLGNRTTGTANRRARIGLALRAPLRERRDNQRGKTMKTTIILAIALGVDSLAACNKSPNERAAQNVESNYGNAADNVEAGASIGGEAIEAYGENASSEIKATGKNKAATIRKEGKEKANAIRNQGNASGNSY